MRSWAALFQYCSVITSATCVVILEEGKGGLDRLVHLAFIETDQSASR